MSKIEGLTRSGTVCFL